MEKIHLSDIMYSFYYQTGKQFEDCITEGLKRKGFEFNSFIELEKFIRTNCRCERLKNNTIIYLVNDDPFLVYQSQNPSEMKITENDGYISINYSPGTYSYPEWKPINPSQNKGSIKRDKK